MWTSEHKLSSAFARRMTALCAKLCVGYFREDNNSVNFDFVRVARLDFRCSFSLLDEN